MYPATFHNIQGLVRPVNQSAAFDGAASLEWSSRHGLCSDLAVGGVVLMTASWRAEGFGKTPESRIPLR